MQQSKLFPKTKKEAPKDAESINHKFLVRAGFIDQLSFGEIGVRKDQVCLPGSIQVAFVKGSL